MARRSNKCRIFSSISDEQLAMKIARDFNRVPSEFSKPQPPDEIHTGVLLKNTSARGIEPMKKWL